MRPRSPAQPVLSIPTTPGGRFYDEEPDAAPGMAADERGHARTIVKLIDGARPSPRQQIARREHWHRTDRSGSLRAAVFGVSDGLVSNTALVMDFAGSGATRTAILLAGIAALLAGAFSMAAGEYMSMSGQREMYQREISLEATELAASQRKNAPSSCCSTAPRGWIGPTPNGSPTASWPTRRSPWTPSPARSSAWTLTSSAPPGPPPLSSLLAFAVGAFVVVLPSLIGGGLITLLVTIGLAVLALFAVGAGLGILNGRSALCSGLRQVITGSLAAAITFGVGHLIGTPVS